MGFSIGIPTTRQRTGHSVMSPQAPKLLQYTPNVRTAMSYTSMRLISTQNLTRLMTFS